jgi:hypothetical protein
MYAIRRHLLAVSHHVQLALYFQEGQPEGLLREPGQPERQWAMQIGMVSSLFKPIKSLHGI